MALFARPVALEPLLVVLLLVLGLYLPSSTAAEPTTGLVAVHFLGLAAILVVLLLRRGGMRGARAVANVLAMNVLLGVFTFLSPYGELALGNYASRALLSLLFLVNLAPIDGGRTVRTAFLAVNLASIALAFAILFQVPRVLAWIVDRYSAFYPELVPTMLELGKPVLTFATHSLAGFFFYLFFYASFRTYAAEGSPLFLLIALTWIALAFFLKSVTVYAFAPIAAVQVAWHFGVRSSGRSRLFAALVVVAVSGLLVAQRRSVGEAFEEVKDILTSDNSGLAARYGQGGVIAPSIDYLLEHPFSPIGLGSAVEFSNWDSGIIENLTRGSIPLALCVYGGLFGFLRGNLRDRRVATSLFLAYLAFEIGFANLLYPRTLYFLPFLVVYLNGIAPVSSRRPVPARPLTAGALATAPAGHAPRP